MEELLDDQMAKEIGKRVDQWVTDNGLTHGALANKLGVSRSTVTNIVNGKNTPSLPMLLKIGLITSIDFGDILNPPREKWIVVDTNIIINRTQSLKHIAKLCDRLIVPRVVVDEINYQKDHSVQGPVKKAASIALSEIGNTRGESRITIEETPQGQLGINDDKIYAVAESLARSHANAIVYLLTNDKYFRTLGRDDCQNLRIINSNEYEDIFRQDDGYNVHESQSFFRAVKAGDLDRAKRQLERGHVDVNYIDQASGNTPLHQAIQIRDVRKRREMIRWLLELPQIRVNKCDEDKYELPPISHAVQKGIRGIVQDLITAGANVNEPSSNNAKNPYNTPLMIASWHGNLDLVTLLIENGACVNQQDRGNGFTALIKAVFNNHADVVKYLLSVGADKTIRSWEKKTALDYNEERNANSKDGRAIKAMLMEVNR